MPVKFQLSDQRLKTWLLCHQAYDSVFKCEEAVFAKEGLTTQQHAVLIAIKYIDDPVTVSEVAHWLDRNPNGISMLVDRMVRDGLVKRTRDLRDRRSVRLSMTNKGKEILEQATMSGWELVQEILSCLSDEDLRTFNSILERMREKAFEYLNPGESLEEVKTKESQDIPRFLARMKRRGTAENLGKR